MADVKWIKITTDIFDDEKIVLIESMPEAYAIITVWFKLLCLAGKQNNSGVVMLGRIAYTEKMLATIFRMNESVVTLAMHTFEQFGMIEIIDGVITIPNWDKHQSLDKIEGRNAYMREYMSKKREKQKRIASGEQSENVKLTVKLTDVNSKLTVNTAEIEEDKELDIDKDKDIKKRTSRFSPPTPSDVSDYCREKGYSVDAERFCDFYASKGWKVGSQPMKDWKACVRTWERRETERRSDSQRSGNVFMEMLREEDCYEQV